MPRPTPQPAEDLIKRFEGYHRRLQDGRAAPYLCPANVWTQAWGATRDINGNRVERYTPPVTLEQAEAMLERDLRFFEAGVQRLVRVPLQDNQYGVLVSFSFNLGLGRLQASTLLRRLNGGDYQGAADELPKWVMAGGRRMKGLVLRREAERVMFLTPDPEPFIAPPPLVAESWITRFMRGFNQASAPQMAEAQN